MTRGNKLSGRKRPPIKPAEELLKAIIEDVIKTTTMSFEDWRALSEFPWVPMAIPVSQGRQYRVTNVAIDAAHILTQQTWDAREDFRQTITREKFDNLSFTAIGETILNCRSHLTNDAFFVVLAADYVDILNRLAQQARPNINRHIPCHLFHADQEVPEFSVGPVAFRPRTKWFDHFVINPLERAQIKQVEAGTLKAEDLRQQALASGSTSEMRNAWDILRSLRGYEWVATVRISGHELSQSHHKASILVGLAMDAIGLRFQSTDAMRFTKAGRQHLFSEDRLGSYTNGVFIRGSSVQMPGLGSEPGALAAKMASERLFLDAAGHLLETYMQGRQTGRAPHLVERWANALYWVGEARREASDFMAVVDYGCAADGLSGAGGDAATMTAFAQAALDPKGDATSAESLSIADAVTTVYREGRNKLAHGEVSGLLEDLTAPRAVGDALLIDLFDVVTEQLANVLTDRPQILTINEKLAYRAFQERLRQRS